MSTVAELDISSAEARVPSAPASRDLRRAVRRLDLRRLGFSGIALGFVVEVAVTDNQAVHAGDLLVKFLDRRHQCSRRN